MKTKQKVNKQEKGEKLRWVQDATRKLIHIPTIKREHGTDFVKSYGRRASHNKETTPGVIGETLAGRKGKTWGHR